MCGEVWNVVEKWKLNLSWKILILFLLLNLGVYGTILAEPYSGKFPTAHIRELWQICSVTYQYRQPGIDQMSRWIICDCYTDMIRKDLTPDKVKDMEYEAAKELSAKLINECNIILRKNPLNA